DEVDKMASDYRGDPAAALLETLDPEQNNTFTDHYLEVPYDLSEVFFICTGNDRFQIPSALRDRMDVIEIPGYTEEEKIQIGRNFVLPKVLNEHGLTRGQLQVPEDVMRLVITRYTREAGVRGLERQLATISRKAARRVLEQPGTRVRLGAKNLEQYLGAPRFLPDKPVEEGLVGVAVGLAWTANGGAILPVEVVTMPGKGGLMVTGQLGDVMQESSRAALSYIRSRADELELTDDFPNNLDIHIHLPEGAIPKDGPSAGITMAIAMISALTRRPVRHDLAMTGEITLRGRVLPIGGLKEKALAAHRVGIHTVLIPAENKKDLADIPEKVRQAMTFITVETMDDVIQHALQSERASGGAGDGMEISGVVERLPIAAESPAQREPEPELPPMDLPPTPDTWPPA
ncbi:MAG TPA: S16 family serine protease, partial [Ktedonobacterales bacterium]